MTTTEESQQDDYDSPWKEAIEIMLADFMAFYFPNACRAIYGQRREKHRIIQLLRVIDWLMALPPHLEQRLGQRLTATEGEKHMQYVTSFERLAKEEGVQQGVQRGMQQGVQQGQVELLIRQLTHRFGPLPDEVRPRLERATPAEIETFADRILEANSLEQVFERN